MNRINLLLTAAAIAVTSLAAAGAQANPISIEAIRNGNAPVLLASGNGSAGVAGYELGNFTIDFAATGTPGMPNPNFGSNTLTIKSTSNGTIQLLASETNNKAIVAGFILGLSNNPLSSVTVTESVYADDSNAAFGLGTLLGSASLTPGQTVSLNAPFGDLSKPYSITEVYTISFGEGGGTVDATILEKASAVPEPMSVGLLGMGLAGIGMVRARAARKAKTA